MAEVPPGPSALPASPAEIIQLSVDGCSLLGSGERLERARGDVLALATEAQQATEPKGILKPNQNNVHPNSSAQFHTSLSQLNGVGGGHPEDDEPPCSRARVHNYNHVQHPVCLKAASDRLDSAAAAQCEQSASKAACTARDRSCSPRNNGLDFCADAANITDTDSDQLEGESSGLKTENSRTVGNFSSDGDGREPGPEDAAAAAAAAAVAACAPVAEMANLSVSGGETEDSDIRYVRYESELQMPDIIRLITKDLSEPYSIYTYRYFIHNWPQLCFLAMVGKNCVGAIVCKLDMHKKMFRRGYIAMLAVDSKFRRKGIGTNLVKRAIYAMVDGDCDEVVLETEITNKSALKLYENLGFVRDKRLFRYYLNGVDALRLKLWLR